MKLPAFIRKHSITVEPYGGSGARGDIFGAPEQLQVWVQPRQRVIEGPNGVDVVSVANVLADVADANKLRPQTRVTLPDGKKGRVLEADTSLDLAGPTHYVAVVG